MRAEIWKRIPNFENYKISNRGRLKLKNGCVSNSNSGNVALRKGGKNHWFKRAQLVLLAFRGAPRAEAEWNARHLDDNPTHNWLSNLAWGTHKDNHNDAVRNGKHATKGSLEAHKYSIHLKGVPRSQAVKDKISQTKQTHPERIYKGKQDPKTGRWVSA